MGDDRRGGSGDLSPEDQKDLRSQMGLAAPKPPSATVAQTYDFDNLASQETDYGISETTGIPRP